MRIAVMADIHGNLAALETVLADVRKQKPPYFFLRHVHVLATAAGDAGAAVVPGDVWEHAVASFDWEGGA